MKTMRAARTTLLSAIIASLAACATSPLGRKQLIMVPDAQMSALGEQAFTQMKSETPIERDPVMNAYVQCVAGPLAETAKGRPGAADRWEVVVFRDESANAFALPGGKIGVHTGLLKVAKTPDQLAAVIGHEIGHVIAKHGAERVSQSLAAQGGVAVLNEALGGKSANRQQVLGALVTVGFLLPFSRTQESESDVIGLELMAKAGFDPRASVELWQNMKAASGSAPPEFLSTHPASDTRISRLQENMAPAQQEFAKARADGKNPRCAVPR